MRSARDVFSTPLRRHCLASSGGALDPPLVRSGVFYNVNLALKLSTIRPWRKDDAASLVRHASNRKVWLTLRDLFPHPYTAKDAETYLDRVTQEEQPFTSFCIEVNGSAAGGISIRTGSDVMKYSPELGYWLGEVFWEQGIMSEAVPAFTDYCFQSFPLCRLEAYSFANNPASARVLEKSGYVFEGRLINSVVKDGQLLDSLLYARTIEKEAWKPQTFPDRPTSR